MNVSEWAGRTDFSDFYDFCLGRKDGSVGKSFRSSCKTSSNQSTKPSVWTVGTSEQKLDEKNLSDHRLNSPQFNFLVGVSFQPTKLEKTYAKSRQVRSMSPRIRVFQLKNGFQPPRVTSQFVLNSQATCFSKCWWLPLQSHNHMSQSLSWAQRHEPSAQI